MVVAIPVLMHVRMDLHGAVFMHVSMFVRVIMLPATHVTSLFVTHMAVEVFHVVVMILVRGIENHVEVAGIEARLLHAADANFEALHRQAAEHLEHGRLASSLFLRRSQIEKRRHSHVAADARRAFQVQHLFLGSHSATPFHAKTQNRAQQILRA